MIEIPRAALRAGDIAQNAAFMSYGTNDLTQMTYAPFLLDALAGTCTCAHLRLTMRQRR